MVEGNDNSDPLINNFQRQLLEEKIVNGVNGNSTPPLGKLIESFLIEM